MAEHDPGGAAPPQRELDDVIVRWPDVRAKQVFGHRGYVRAGKMFAFLTDEGVGVKAADDDEAGRLFAKAGVSAFTYRGMEMKQWPVLPLRSSSDVDEALEAVQSAYESVGR
jgi:hypothetical protein